VGTASLLVLRKAGDYRNSWPLEKTATLELTRRANGSAGNDSTVGQLKFDAALPSFVRFSWVALADWSSTAP